MKKVFLLLLAFFFTIQSMTSFSAAADDGPFALPVYVNGERKTVRAFDGEYEGNHYLSLTDFAAALSGTEKQFRFERVVSSTDGEYFSVSLHQPAVSASGAAGLPGFSSTVGLNLFRNRLLVDGMERKYYTHNPHNGDLYMSLVDMQLMLDLSAWPTQDGGISLYLDVPFQPDPEQLRAAGYFESMSGIYLADAETGEVLFEQNGQKSVPVASLSKLLSYLILKEAIDAGEISSNDTVRLSERVQALSESVNGIIPVRAGMEVPFHELVEGMLIASSNESALALAEHLCGDEATFVARMHSRAQELGLNSVLMYTCNGLPSYSMGSVPVKRQNYMNASDLFQLTRLILQKYPEITDITSIQIAHMPSLNDYWTANSNPLVFNMTGITGLKTGNTNRAGYCVVVTMPIQAADGHHNIVLVLLGAETADLRGQAAEILLRYAKTRYQ